MQKMLSVYIHIPFCKQKCLYCDFLSSPASAGEKEAYVEALLREMEREAVGYKEYVVDTVFLGGGTPSLLESRQLESIMDTLHKFYCVTPMAEITIECNPATADFEKLKNFRSMGINRISIGLQTADEEQLKCLGRIHNYTDFLDTYHNARKAGFENINIDLMQALPKQSFESCMETLEKVIALKPEHISAYSLIVEQETPFYEKYGPDKPFEMLLPDEDTERAMYQATGKRLKEAGYNRYEISNYARENKECRHNTAYWVGKDYVGFGIGAASYVKGIRFSNTSDRKRYEDFFLTKKWEEILSLNGIKEQVQELTEKEKMEEYMFLGLRMMKGVSKKEFLDRFAVDMESIYGDVLQKQKKAGLLEEDTDRIFLTERGIDVSNVILADFLL